MTTDDRRAGEVVIIAQARMGSTRLPGKVMMPIGGLPMVDLVVARASRAELADALVVATTDLPEDDVLFEHLQARGTRVVRGSADDVLARYALAARESSADVVVRITCDCPLIDPEIVDLVIRAFLEHPEVDYASNTLVRTYPIGMDTEVFSADALTRADAEASAPHEREHVTPHLYQHPETFTLHNVEAPEPLRRPETRLTVDEERDLEVVQAIVRDCGPDAALAEMLGFLDARPEVALLNADVEHRHVDKPETW